MKFKSAAIEDFKRFTSLKIQGIPQRHALSCSPDQTGAASPRSLMLCTSGENQGTIVASIGMPNTTLRVILKRLAMQIGTIKYK